MAHGTDVFADEGSPGRRPDVTFLDDGNITYKDLEHGAFELVTKEAVPRHFLVEDPGQTIVLRPQGSSVSVNQVTNSPARMAELQEAQQEVLATATKGVGSTGSSTPPSDNSLPVQPINFIQNDSLQPAQNGLAPLPASFVTIPETIIGRLPPPAPTPPTFNALTGPVETDTVAFDLFTATTGTFVASAPNGGALTFGISGGTAGSTVLDGATYDVSQVGPFGTLFVNSATGAYTFVPDNDAINALTEPTAANFTVTVSDGTLSANQTFTIAINGTNDAAVISGDITGSAIEAGSVAHALSGPLIATGTLTNTDVDNPPNTFTAVNSPTPSKAGYGTFTMTAAGVWVYTLDNANHAVQALNVGDTLTDTFTVTTVDGTPQLVTVTINGSNDAAIISGATTGSVTEDGDAKCGTPTATGTLTDADVDNPSNTFTAVDSPTASDGGYGTFTMTADGVWTYTLNDDNRAVQALNVGDTLTDTFTVTTVDGTEQVVTVTINGTNDAAVISGTKTGCGDRGRWRRQCQVRQADGDRHADRYRHRQCAQHLHGGHYAKGEHRRLRHLHHDGGRRVDLHARRHQQRGAGAQCLRHADRHVHGDHHRRHPAGGDDHHRRHQRRGHHFRHQDRLGDRGRRRHATARRPRPARSPIPTSTIRPTASSRSTGRGRAMPATAPSR